MTYNNFESYANSRSNERKRFNPRNVTISAIEDLYRENQFLKRKINSKDVLIRNIEYEYAVLQRNKTERKEFRNNKQNGSNGKNNNRNFKRKY